MSYYFVIYPYIMLFFLNGSLIGWSGNHIYCRSRGFRFDFWGIGYLIHKFSQEARSWNVGDATIPHRVSLTLRKAVSQSYPWSFTGCVKLSSHRTLRLIGIKNRFLYKVLITLANTNNILCFYPKPSMCDSHSHESCLFLCLRDSFLYV